MSDYYAGQWLENRTNGFMVEVVKTTPGGGVTVIADGKETNTSARYLDWLYRELGAA